MSDITHLTDISIVDGNIKVNIPLSQFNDRFKEAQQWLGDRVLEDSRAFMSLRTGNLQQRSHVQNDGREVVFPGPYARFQFMGKVMVDPVTGSPWARAGAKKVLTDRPLTYSSPSATDHWFDEAKAQYVDYWINGVRERILGEK